LEMPLPAKALPKAKVLPGDRKTEPNRRVQQAT
jgi:hypothetical protein